MLRGYFFYHDFLICAYIHDILAKLPPEILKLDVPHGFQLLIQTRLCLKSHSHQNWGQRCRSQAKIEILSAQNSLLHSL